MTEQLPDADELAARLDALTAQHTRWRDGGTVNLNAATNSLSRRARMALRLSSRPWLADSAACRSASACASPGADGASSQGDSSSFPASGFR